ncbi:hypothetical protein EII14_02015 [Alloprevotella sp. OH1205_COT-284]|uniref:hypothetical protein n=1 Tax=Alloprevotella sp. OH1205_COT-284 TaxID=2491043 RepID=UPI000F5DC3B4|nr:hypothetical protein [Alloprevotella sp. OH1205_COT-284]RRD80417.1 hypothetical protein EII14_02015 [Alloprevotella sp. OH1205_COT-284]
MLKRLRSVFTLAVLFLLLSPTLLMIEQSVAAIRVEQVAWELIVLSVAFFAFSLMEMFVIHALEKSSSYYLGANLLFSLLRLLLTAGLLFYFKWKTTSDFTIVFVNVLVLYFATLLYSTWCRQKENKQKVHTS